uniref:Uncharacterized protein n=1 Tax=Tetranychus urticae TaxID=32264 RepID=T1JXX1_TETUR
MLSKKEKEEDEEEQKSKLKKNQFRLSFHDKVTLGRKGKNAQDDNDDVFGII